MGKFRTFPFLFREMIPYCLFTFTLYAEKKNAAGFLFLVLGLAADPRRGLPPSRSDGLHSYQRNQDEGHHPLPDDSTTRKGGLLGNVLSLVDPASNVPAVREKASH